MIITNQGFAVIERDTHLSRWVIEHKRLDFDSNALPQMLPYIKPHGVVMDIGANIGCYAYAFAKVANSVVCFEPNPEAFECLEFNLKGNQYLLLKDAVSDKSTGYDVVCENDNIGMAYIHERKDGKFKTVTIDGLNLEVVDFMKLDCEGNELKVLKGAENTINKHRPVMVIEINDHTLARTKTSRHQIFKWLTDHNYTFRNIYKEQGLEDDQLDIICFPA